VQPVAAGPGRRLTEKSSTLFPRWSRDGKSIFFVDDRSISSVPASGGESRQIMKIGPEGPSTMEFSFAPDGASFAAAYGRLPDRRLWRFPAAGGDGLALTKGQAASPSWSPDGAWIYFTTFRDGGGATYQLERAGLNIWRVSSDGVREVPVTRLTGRHGYLGLKIANDGKYIYFTWREDVSDIWMMDVEYEKR
jgi:Tol biopolymer transport system component